MELRGRAALVTGAGVRVGRALALALAREGARVAVHYGQSADAAEQTADAARALGADAVIVQADLAHDGAVRALLADLQTRWGTVDVLVNSAAIFEPAGVRGTTPELWDRHFAINLKAPFLLSQAFAAQLPAGRAGKIVNISDWRGLRPGGDHFAYTLTKAALISMTKSLAVALAPAIQVNCLALGAILLPAGADESYRRQLVAQIPAGRMGDLSEVADALIFALKNDFVTGQTIVIDGGRSLV
jgi:pteridine reductase